MIHFKHSGNFNKTERFLKKSSELNFRNLLESYAQKGVNALAKATPTRSGKTAASWNYEIEESKNSIVIHWNNDNINKGVNIAVIIQYGHGTNNGGYVQGIDYINPALAPIFEEIADGIWKEVTS